MFLPVAAAMYTCVYYFTLVKLKNEERILVVSMLLSPT
jgi:hypothetical protein